MSLGWGIVALGLIAVFCGWLGSRGHAHGSDLRREHRRSLARVPVLVIVAVAALVCSLSPERTIGAFTFVRPSALLYDVVPMFRSYARFGVVVQLMAALLAGIGVDYLRRAGTRRAQIVCLALVALAAGEYAVWPSALWRDVLPTTAHRWVVRQPVPAGPRLRAARSGVASVQWLTGHRVASLALDERLHGAEPVPEARGDGYTHLLVRRDTADDGSPIVRARRIASRRDVSTMDRCSR